MRLFPKKRIQIQAINLNNKISNFLKEKGARIFFQTNAFLKSLKIDIY